MSRLFYILEFRVAQNDARQGRFFRAPALFFAVFCGFFSKWNICQAAFACGDWLSVAGVAVLLISALLTTVYMFTVFLRAFFSPFREGSVPVKESCRQMLIPIVGYAAAILLLGIFSKPFYDLIFRLIFHS